MFKLLSKTFTLLTIFILALAVPGAMAADAHRGGQASH